MCAQKWQLPPSNKVFFLLQKCLYILLIVQNGIKLKDGNGKKTTSLRHNKWNDLNQILTQNVVITNITQNQSKNTSDISWL